MSINPQQPQPWSQGGYPPPQPVAPTSGLAVASLVCGIVGFFAFGLTSIPGVILGHMATRETRTGQRNGHGLAITGLILNWLQVVGWLLFWILIGGLGVAGAFV